MRGASIRAVLFDFDYTLADSSRGIVESANAGFRALGLDEEAADRIAPTIGLSLPAILRELKGVDDTDIAQRFSDAFVRHADRVMVESTQIFAPVPRLLDELRGSGRRLGVVTTKFRRRIDAILAAHELEECFDVVVGGDDVKRHKPDPEGLALAIDHLGEDLDRALYVGDHLVDAQAAEALGVAFVGVLTGRATRETFAAHPALAVIDDVSGVMDLLASR